MTKATLTAAAKRQIAADWSQHFPNLSATKPMWLMKRNGPVLMGIRFDRTRSNDVYIPVFHVHNLLARSAVVMLTLYHALPDERQPRLKREIRVDRHADEFGMAVAAMKKQVPELGLNDISLSRVLGLYREYLESGHQPAISKYPVTLFTDVILLSYWAGYPEYANRSLERALAAMRAWPSHEVDLDGWRRSIQEQLNQERLQGVLEEQLVHHKLQAVPVYGLERDTPPEPPLAEVYGRSRFA
jgi:hypothetical protein